VAQRPVSEANKSGNIGLEACGLALIRAASRHAFVNARPPKRAKARVSGPSMWELESSVSAMDELKRALPAAGGGGAGSV
jgi:hypothetical protein